MAQYPIDFLKRNDGSRFFPVTHVAAVYDGQESLYQILDKMLAQKAPSVVKMNNGAIYNDVLVSNLLSVSGGGGNSNRTTHYLST